ncbi:MAG: cupin domain-containing protein [Planctomycetota bacterium]
MTLPTIDELVAALRLQRHPEGGWFARTFTAHNTVPGDALPARFAGGARPWSTAIFYLLPAGEISRLHRIAADELWHFHLGSPLTIGEIEPADGRVTTTTLGPDVVTRGHRLQHAVPGGRWFGAWPAEAADDDGAAAPYSLVGCTVSPGFDFADFALGDRDELLAQYPHARELIDRLAPSS